MSRWKRKARIRGGTTASTPPAAISVRSVVTSVAKPARPPGGSGILVPPRPTWEYTILALGNSLERQVEQLTRMGALGWELVSLIAPGPPHGGLSLAYLKRPMTG